MDFIVEPHHSPHKRSPTSTTTAVTLNPVGAVQEAAAETQTNGRETTRRAPPRSYSTDSNDSAFSNSSRRSNRSSRRHAQQQSKTSGAAVDYGYGDATPDNRAPVDYGYGDATPDVAAAQDQYGYGNGAPDVSSNANKYGYGDAAPDNSRYGYEDAAPDNSSRYGYGNAVPDNSKYGYGDATPDNSSGNNDYGYGDAAPDSASGNDQEFPQSRRRSSITGGVVTKEDHLRHSNHTKNSNGHSTHGSTAAAGGEGYQPPPARTRRSSLTGGMVCSVPQPSASRRVPRRSSMKGGRTEAESRQRRSSIQFGTTQHGEVREVHIPGQGKVKRRTSIGFDSQVNVRQVIPAVELALSPTIKSPSSEEMKSKKTKSQLWFQQDEYQKMKQKSFDLIDLVDRKGGIDQFNNGKKPCIRGLESLLNNNGLSKEIAKEQAWESVLEEQYEQRSRGRFDEEVIKDQYMQFGNTEQSQKMAQHRAQQDAKDIENYTKNTRRYLRRLSC